MVLKHFILPEKHFKTNFFFPIMIPLTQPTTHPRDYRGGDTVRGEGGLIKVKKQVDFRIHFRWFKAFLNHVFFPLRVLAGRVGPLMENSINFFFWNRPLLDLFWLDLTILKMNFPDLTSLNDRLQKPFSYTGTSSCF